jgi:hypothetical protein
MWFRFSYAELCLPTEAIRSAVGDLAASPLYELFQTHLLQLYRFLDEDVPASAAESLGSATLELARAAIATVGQGDLTRNDAANQALVTRIEAYVQQHLADPALSPEGIARGPAAPVIGGLPAVGGPARDTGTPLDERGGGLAEEPGSSPGPASREDTRSS